MLQPDDSSKWAKKADKDMSAQEARQVADLMLVTTPGHPQDPKAVKRSEALTKLALGLGTDE